MGANIGTKLMGPNFGTKLKADAVVGSNVAYALASIELQSA